MKIKNACVYQTPSLKSLSPVELEDKLSGAGCPAIAGDQEAVSGFAPVLPDVDKSLFLHGIESFAVAVDKTVERKVPPAILKEHLADLVKRIEDNEGRKVARAEKAELREYMKNKLLSRAFPKTTHTTVIFDFKTGRTIVDTSSVSRAEDVLTSIRSALETFPAAPLTPELDPAYEMTRWLLAISEPPELFWIGDRCELAGDEKSKVRVDNLEVESEQVRSYLNYESMQVSKLAIEVDSTIEFDLTSTLGLRKIRVLDSLDESFDSIEADDAVDELKARLFLYGKTLRGVIQIVEDHFDVRSFDDDV